MKQIWKYPLTDYMSTIKIPGKSEILTAQMQGDVPTIWALVNTKEPMTERTFAVYGTGWNITDKKFSYINTVQQSNGLVFHVFEVIK